MKPLRLIELVSRSGVRLRIQDRSQPDEGGESLTIPDASCATAVSAPMPAALPALAWSADPDGLLAPLRLRENADYFFTLRLRQPLGATLGAAAAARASGDPWPFRSAATSRIAKLMPRETWKDDPPSGCLVYATANFGSFVGVADLTLHDGDEVFAEICASKLNYENDFRLLLSEVAAEIIDLIFQVGSVAGLKFAIEGSAEARPAVILFHLRRLMRPNALPAALEAVVQEPLSRLVSSEHRVPPARAGALEPELLAARAASLPMQMGGPLAAQFLGHTPEQFVMRRRNDSVDVPENRYVKAFAEDLALLCRDLAARFPAKVGSGRAEAMKWAESVEDALSAPLWREVGPLTAFPANSQALLRRSPYREILDADLQLRTGLALPWERAGEIIETVGDLRPIFELYEYWCFFMLRRILRGLCGNEAPALGDLFVERNGRLSIDLRRGKKSKVEFGYDAGSLPVTVQLFYNRSFRRPQDPLATYEERSYSTEFRPDYSLRFQTREAVHWLHFDAKYRLDLAAWMRQVQAEDVASIEEALVGSAEEDSAFFKKADLYKVHAYRDAILSSRGAFVIFPGEGQASLFTRHPDPAYRATMTIPSVGAFPLRPGSPPDQLQQLRKFIALVLEVAADPPSAYVDEFGFG